MPNDSILSCQVLVLFSEKDIQMSAVSNWMVSHIAVLVWRIESLLVENTQIRTTST